MPKPQSAVAPPQEKERSLVAWGIDRDEEGLFVLCEFYITGDRVTKVLKRPGDEKMVATAWAIKAMETGQSAISLPPIDLPPEPE